MEHKLIDFHSIGPDLKISGDLQIKGETFLFGSIEGNVEVLDESQFVLENTGKMQGDFQGADLVIRGEFEGDIKSRGKVSLMSSAKVTGKIDSQSLEVAPGAELSLRIS